MNSPKIATISYVRLKVMNGEVDRSCDFPLPTQNLKPKKITNNCFIFFLYNIRSQHISSWVSISRNSFHIQQYSLQSLTWFSLELLSSALRFASFDSRTFPWHYRGVIVRLSPAVLDINAHILQVYAILSLINLLHFTHPFFHFFVFYYHV